MYLQGYVISIYTKIARKEKYTYKQIMYLQAIELYNDNKYIFY